MSIKEFMKELNGTRAEGELIKTLLYSVLTGFLTLAILYFLRLKNVENFFRAYGTQLFFVVLSYALVSTSLRQVRAYRELPCMSGMMVGMTTGMIAGFLPGFYVASTNGMFVGSVFGMALGIIIGVLNGKCCGIMGAMEGIMAGFMGGLMGAMTAFMLLNDNIKAASVIVFAISAIIVVGLNYMIYKDMKEAQRQRTEDQLFNIIFSFVMTIITAWLMISGPKSGLFG